MIKSFFIDLFDLFFPRICHSCGDNLGEHENSICTLCLYKLPKTDFHTYKDNPVSKLFWGKSDIFNATSFCFFTQGGILQELIHKLKYKGAKEIGKELGEHFGAVLAKADLYKDIDLIVPVPLHPARLTKRGYNQSEWICNGIAGVMNKPVDLKNLYRKHHTQTQTKKGRLNRFENMENMFAIKNPDLYAGKHILLVDDVITTGATIESCAGAILAAPGAKVSVVSIGVSMK